jgi:hypothetical protein
MLTAILSIINFFSGSAFQGIVSAVTGVVGKLSDDKAAEFTAAAGAEQAVLVARMQADSQAYQARIGLYRGMFWLQIVLMLAYVGRCGTRRLSISTVARSCHCSPGTLV